MKPGAIVIFISIVTCSFVNGQDSSNSGRLLHVSAGMSPIRVKDSSGQFYSSSEWLALVSSGKYILKPIGNPAKSKEFLLVAAPDSFKALGPKPLPSNFFKTGERFQDFATKDTGENNLNTADFAGRILVLNFWFIDCPPCRSEIPALNQLAELYQGDSSVVFVAVALDGKSRLKTFLEKNQFGYKMVYNGRSIAAQYGIGLFPTTVVVDQQQKIIFHTTGFANNTVPWLRKTIEELKLQSAGGR